MAAQTDNPSGQLFFAPKQVEHRYGIPEKTLEVWRYRGVGPPYHKFGRLVRYAVADLDEWARSNARSNTSEIG